LEKVQQKDYLIFPKIYNFYFIFYNRVYSWYLNNTYIKI
jgi:hypothetical protein